MRSSRVRRASFMCCGRSLMAMISRRSSLANSVMSSPWTSRSLVGRAVSKSVKFSVFMVLTVAASPFPRSAPKTMEKRMSTPRLNAGRCLAIFIVCTLYRKNNTYAILWRFFTSNFALSIDRIQGFVLFYRHYGVLAKLVIALACHAGDHGFESRTSR